MVNVIKVNPEALKTDLMPDRDIQYIVVHYTAGSTSEPGYAHRIAEFFMNPDIRQSSDFIVDDETIVQFNPDILNRFSWHCGGAKAPSGGRLYCLCTNENSIGIELSSTNRAGKITFPGDPQYSFTDEVITNAAELIRRLMEEYNIDISHVIRHYDVNGKECPGVPGWYGEEDESPDWIKFRNRLK